MDFLAQLLRRCIQLSRQAKRVERINGREGAHGISGLIGLQVADESPLCASAIAERSRFSLELLYAILTKYAQPSPVGFANARRVNGLGDRHESDVARVASRLRGS